MRRWPLGLRAAHWLLALCVIATATLAIVLVYPPEWSDPYIQRYVAGIEYHKALGLVAFIAALALALQHHKRPPHTGSALEQRAARIAHLALIVLALATPAVGFAANAFWGEGIALPGLPPLVSPVSRNERIGAVLTYAHDAGAYAFLALIALHVLAALRRQLLRRDPVITDMLGVKSKDARR